MRVYDDDIVSKARLRGIYGLSSAQVDEMLADAKPLSYQSGPRAKYLGKVAREAFIKYATRDTNRR